MADAAEIDRLFCEAYSNACVASDPGDLYRSMERMHDAFAELLRLHRLGPIEPVIG